MTPFVRSHPPEEARIIDAVPDAPAARRRSWVRWVGLAAFSAAAVALFGYQARQIPQINGDGWEYLYMVESLHRHGTPELRPEDEAAVNDEAAALALPKPPVPAWAYEPAKDGRRYGVHFWAYGASAVPAKAYLRWAGARSELSALGLANAAWFVLALAVVLFVSRAAVTERLALAALTAAGPLVYYIDWTGAEMFSAALALIGVSFFRDRRYALAAAAAGLAATQNPPIVFLGVAAIFAAAWDRRWRGALAAVFGTGISLLPFAFFQYHFGNPNLIASEYATFRNVSWVRSWGLVADASQGLLPYAPVLVAAALAGAARLVWTRNARGLILLGGATAVALAVQVAHNWNSACLGLQRYLVWMIPLAAGVAVEGLAGRRLLPFAVAAAVLVHAAVFRAHEKAKTLEHAYFTHTPAAKWLLTHHPRAYWVEPEVFIERQLERDDWPNTPASFPVGFARPDGTVSKLLLDARSVGRVGELYDADPDYLAALTARAAGERGLFYAHPPAGAVRVRPPK